MTTNNTETTELAGRLVHRDATERARRAWLARMAGASWDEAAKVAGYSDRSNCCRAVRRYFGSLPQPDPEQERELWRQRLEYLWKLARQDADARRPGAIRAAVAVAQRAAQMGGYDEPSRITVSNPSDAYLREWVRSIEEKQIAALPQEADIIEAEPV